MASPPVTSENDHPNQPIVRIPSPIPLPNERAQEYDGEVAEFRKKFQTKTWRAAQDDRPLGSPYNRRALVIAIAYNRVFNGAPPSLTGTYADAIRVIKMLETFDYKPDDICVLADIELQRKGTAGRAFDKSRRPDWDNIVTALNWLAENSGTGQIRFLYFSGHGHFQRYKDIGGQSFKSREGIVPYDVDCEPLQQGEGCECYHDSWNSEPHLNGYTRFLMPRLLTIFWDYNLNQVLGDSLLPGTKLTALFDCCYSGGTLETATQAGPGRVITDLDPPGESSSKGPIRYPNAQGPMNSVPPANLNIPGDAIFMPLWCNVILNFGVSVQYTLKIAISVGFFSMDYTKNDFLNKLCSIS